MVGQKRNPNDGEPLGLPPGTVRALAFLVMTVGVVVIAVAFALGRAGQPPEWFTVLYGTFAAYYFATRQAATGGS